MKEPSKSVKKKTNKTSKFKIERDKALPRYVRVNLAIPVPIFEWMATQCGPSLSVGRAIMGNIRLLHAQAVGGKKPSGVFDFALKSPKKKDLRKRAP